MTLEEKAGLCAGSNFWYLTGVPRLGIPAVMATDGPHGIRKQAGAADHLGLNASEVSVCFPTAAALASSFDTQLLREVGAALGRECQAENVGILLGPGVNIKRSPLCGRNFEYFSEDPFLSGALGAAHVTGLQSEGIACSVKHFAANNQETDRMTSDSVVDERTLNELYLAAFEAPVKEAKAKTVMCAYNRLNGVFAAENEFLLTDVLRDRWGFEGLVVTDWGAVKDRIKGLKAGLDLKMPGGNPEDPREILSAIEEGRLTEKQLDVNVERILSVLNFILENRREDTVFDYAKDHQKAHHAAVESAVLLKNDGKCLPLTDAAGPVVFMGAFAKAPRYQGSGSSHINCYQVDNALQAAGDRVSFVEGYRTGNDSGADALIREAVSAAKAAGTAVIFAGLPSRDESEGYDRTHMNLPENQNRLIAEVSAVQPNTVVVLHNGSAVTMPWIDRVPAVLEMYLGGEAVGAAAVDLLFGEAVPSGKLAETFPLRLEDNPSFLNFPGEQGVTEYREGLYVGYRYYDSKNMPVLFPFGHGLSYTEFQYSNLVVDRTQIDDTQHVHVQMDVTNIGTVPGKEVVQLYIKPQKGEISRPVHELKGFQKIALNPGETKQVSFILDRRAFSYYNIHLHDWHVETGSFEIEVGASSRDIRQRISVCVQSTVEPPQVFTIYSTIGQVLKTPKGQQILGPVIAAAKQKSNLDADTMESAMGEGSGEMVQAMMMQMSLFSLMGFGMFQKDQLEGIVAQLNG